MNKFLLKDIARIDISGVDKKVKENEIPVKLCNFTDVYYNWAITDRMYNKFMDATANSNEIERYKLKKGMLAITKDSETRDDIGMATYIADDFENVILGYHTALIIPDVKKVNSKFLNAYLNSSISRKHFSNNASGSGQRYTLTVESIGDLPVYLPSLESQKKIGNIFSYIDNKIENNTQINNNLEELMKTIYQRWFIEFEFPNEEGKPYKSFGGKLIYNENLKREIPEGWGVENIVKNQLTSIVENGVDYFESKQYLATGDVEENEILSSSMIEYETRESRANMQPIINSVWFAKMKNSIKHLCFGEYSIEMINNYILSTGFCGLKCAEHSFEYINEFINSEYFEKHKDVLAHGATQEAVNNEDLKNIKILIPNDCILREFHNISKDIYEQIYNNKLEKQKLIKTREFLLPLLMNGQINVDDIEI